ncbi:MAG: type I-B CRISPR-associated endonuclease Cas1b [Candidatus Nitrosocaldaceae archaeon]
MKKRIYLFSNGVLARESNTLVLIKDDKKHFIPVVDVNSIYVFGEVDINKRLLEFLTKHHIQLHFFNYYGYYIGSYLPRRYYNAGIVTLKQAEYYIDKKKRFTLARSIAYGSIRNTLVVLNYYNNRGINLKDEIDMLTGIISNINRCVDITELMGNEGNAKEIYYQAFNKILNDRSFLYEGRRRRPPTTKLNTLISFGNSILYVTILNEIAKTHLDPRIGYLHSTTSRKFSLNLDISEIFKPILVDRCIFTLVNKSMLNEKDFIQELNGIYLSENGKKKFLQEFESRLNTTILHKRLKRKIRYSGIIRIELYKLEKHFLNDEEYKPFIMKW